MLTYLAAAIIIITLIGVAIGRYPMLRMNRLTNSLLTLGVGILWLNLVT